MELFIPSCLSVWLVEYYHQPTIWPTLISNSKFVCKSARARYVCLQTTNTLNFDFLYSYLNYLVLNLNGPILSINQKIQTIDSSVSLKNHNNYTLYSFHILKKFRFHFHHFISLFFFIYWLSIKNLEQIIMCNSQWFRTLQILTY